MLNSKKLEEHQDRAHKDVHGLADLEAEMTACEASPNACAHTEEEIFEQGYQIAMEQEEAEERQHAREAAEAAFDGLT